MPETEYRVAPDGRIIMSFRVFKELKFESLCKTLGIPTTVEDKDG